MRLKGFRPADIKIVDVWVKLTQCVPLNQIDLKLNQTKSNEIKSLALILTR